MTTIDIADLDVRTRLAELDRIYAHTHQLVADLGRVKADTDRRRQEMRYQPVLAMIAGMTSGAALLAAGAALMKIFGGA